MAGAGVLGVCQGECLVKDSQRLSEAPHGAERTSRAQAVFWLSPKALQEPTPQREGGRELAPLEGSGGHRRAYRSLLGGL
jgi:hypothetical protein